MKKGYTHVSILIDRSGSMSRLKKDVIGGFNQLIEDQQKEDGELTISLVQFDDNGGLQFEATNDFSPVKEVVLLTEANYMPRGGTPLNDALARLINETGAKLAAMSEDNRPEKVLFVTITDGEENSSKEQTTASIKQMIEHQESVYNWKFLYIGANQDSFAEAGARGMSGGLNFAASATGTTAMYSAISTTMTNARSVDVQAFSGIDFSEDLDKTYKKKVTELEKKEEKETQK
jgi:Mg-chelatase subunit ChlD